MKITKKYKKGFLLRRCRFTGFLALVGILCFSPNKKAVASGGDGGSGATPESKHKIVFSEEFSGSELPGAYSTHLKNAEFKVADGALQVVVSKPFPSCFSMTIPKIKVTPNSRCVASVSYSFKNVSENADQKQSWLKRPKLPKIRLIFLDAKGKRCVSVKKYVWVCGKFTKKTPKTMVAKHSFKVPENAKFVVATLFLEAKGEYEIKSLKIEEK